MVSRITISTRGSESTARSERRATFQPSDRASCSASPNRRGFAAPAPAAVLGARPAPCEMPARPALPRPSSCCRRRSPSARRRHPEIAQHAIARPASTPPRTDRDGGPRPAARSTDSSSESNFKLPVTTTRAEFRAQVDEAARRLFTLHEEAIDVIHHAAHHRTDHPIAREGARGDAPVDDRGLDPAGAALADRLARFPSPS